MKPPSAPMVTGELEGQESVPAIGGRLGTLTTVLCAALSLYAVYWTLAVVETRVYRTCFLALALAATFLAYPASPARRGRVSRLDVVLALLVLPALGWPLWSGDAFAHRAAEPTAADIAFGFLAIGLALEATRRTVGWILPATAVAFLGYAFGGPALDRIGLSAIAHRGYDVPRLVGTLYMTLEGLFGVPLDVAATYIVLFSLYGAVLEASGATRFFLDWSFAAFGRSAGGAGPGRTVTAAGFLLGTVSGSGVATTVALGSAAWPLLRAAGYPAETAGAILSAAGIGALLSPPTLGAAAFLIAEFLKIPYLQVLVMATVPTVLYYLSIALMIEADARRLAPPPPEPAPSPRAEPPSRSLREVTLEGGHHFLSLIAVAVLMAAGFTAFRAVLWATLLAIATALLRSASAGKRELLTALPAGGRGVLSVTATTATAGIVVGVTTLTGLGLKAAGLIVALAGGNTFLTVCAAAVAVWLLGLAVPVTASYVLAAVMIAPALTRVGIPDVAAHMFIFYYAVLSEVSPPTALSPFAAAALTGGNPFRTMMRTWRYTLPAFLVPFGFATSPEGMGLLLQAPPADVARSCLTAAAGVGALAVGLGGWLGGPVPRPARVLSTLAGVLLFHGSATADLAGLALGLLAGGLHFARRRRS